MDIRTRQQHVDALMSAGLDQAAEILAEWIASLDDGSEHYRDGAEDALSILTQAGAADPRSEPETIHLHKPRRVACGAKGPVRVTERASEVTCSRCLDAEHRDRVAEQEERER